MFFGTDYTAAAFGSAIKLVQCERCAHEYGYVMTRRIKRSAFSPYDLSGRQAEQLSQRRAEKGLRKALESGCDPVPCPQCGWYQEAMVQRIKRRRLRWVLKLAIAMIPLSLFLFMIPLSFRDLSERQQLILAGVILGSAWGLVVLLLALRFLVNRLCDPNSGPAEQRIALGRRRAMSKEECLRRMECPPAG